MKAEFIYVQFSDGEQYRIPAEFIAKHRAMYYAMTESIEVFNQEIERVLEDGYELLDWAVNSMDWSDICHVAELIRDKAIANKQKEWPSAGQWVQYAGQGIQYAGMSPNE